MGDSNGEWGQLVEHDDDLAEVWDGWPRLPDTPDVCLAGFLQAKGHGLAELLRLGARYRDGVLCYSYGTGLKYRDIATGRRWSYMGSEFSALKIVPSPQPSGRVIVCEGESDAGRLLVLYPTCDVAVMGAGAKHFTQHMADQLEGYDQVLVGLDRDEAGDDGTRKILKLVPQALEFRPDTGDWCELDGEAPELPEVVPYVAPEIIVSLGDMLELEIPEIASWLEHDVLPIGGFLMLHGWAKSFKTFLGVDLMSALAQGREWCCLEPREEPCKVAVMQYELKWAYYRQRMAMLLDSAPEPALLRENFHTYSPLARPDLRAGDTKSEDKVLSNLVSQGIQVFMIDPIRRATGSIDMNDEAEVRKMLGFFERLNDEGITVIATHHDNKSFAKVGGGDPLGMTGSGAWSGDPDTILSVQLPYGESLTSTKRNVCFTLRNSPAIDPRGFEMTDHGMLYSPRPWGPAGDQHQEAAHDAANDEDLPSI